MTNPTLERAARAAYEAWIDDVRDLEPAWDDLPESHRERLAQSARAVLMAVRDMPMSTVSDIFTARDGFVHTLDIPAVWQLGIDAILNDGEGE